MYSITNTFTHSLTHTRKQDDRTSPEVRVQYYVRTLSERTCRAEKVTGIVYCTQKVNYYITILKVKHSQIMGVSSEVYKKVL